MPSKSKAQQRFFGMVDAYKKGEMKNPSSKIKKAAKGMSMSDVKDFAETKHKGLPEKVEENMEKRIIRMTESDLHNLVKESVERILKESFGNYVFYCYTPGIGNDSMLIKKPNDALKYIQNAKYWDITKGSNTSELENLVAWGGEGGYWSNILQDTKNEGLRQYILSKKKN